VLLAEDLEREPVRYQGNWIPHRLRPATEDGIFFAGDSAGHCLPLTAEGIRTALYFGIAEALTRYGDFSAAHRWKFDRMLDAQRLVPRVPPRVLAAALRGMRTKAFVDWSFGHYLAIAPPEFAAGPPAPALRRSPPSRAAA
jgi:hypothetical protein